MVSKAASEAGRIEAAAQIRDESRQRWLFWGCVASLGWGLFFVAVGCYVLATVGPNYVYPNGRLAASDIVSGWLYGGLLAAFAAWALRDAGGFKHGVYDRKSSLRKILYWLAALFGLVTGVVLVIVALIGVGILFGAAGSGEGGSYESDRALRRRQGTDW